MARAKSDTLFHCIVHIIPQGPGGPGVRDSDVPKNTAIKIPGDSLALLMKWDELSNRLLCDEGVIAVALCPPGMMCKLDCPWLSPFLFVTLSGWFAARREHLVLTALRRDYWEPGGGGGARVLTSFLQGCVPVLYQDFAPKLDLNLFYRLLDLVNCFELSWGIGLHDVSSMWAHPGLFGRSL